MRCLVNQSYGRFLIIIKKKPNTLFKNEFKFRIFIEKKVFSFHSVRKYDFLDNKIFEIYNDE